MNGKRIRYIFFEMSQYNMNNKFDYKNKKNFKYIYILKYNI